MSCQWSRVIDVLASLDLLQDQALNCILVQFWIVPFIEPNPPFCFWSCTAIAAQLSELRNSRGGRSVSPVDKLPSQITGDSIRKRRNRLGLKSAAIQLVRYDLLTATYRFSRRVTP